MELTIESVDYAPAFLDSQTPIVTDTLHQIPGDDRPDYWLVSLRKPIRCELDRLEHTITHLVLAARWQGTCVEPGIKHLPINIAIVTDETLLADSRLDFEKCAYVALGFANDTTDGPVAPLSIGAHVRQYRPFAWF